MLPLNRQEKVGCTSSYFVATSQPIQIEMLLQCVLLIIIIIMKIIYRVLFPIGSLLFTKMTYT